MIARNLYLLFLLLLSVSGVVSPFPAMAQMDSTWSDLRHFNKKNGLPTDLVYSCIQDHNGYIWMATEKGLVKYNGYDFKIFTTADGLPVNDIWRVFEDPYGRLWIFNHSYELGYIKNDIYKAVLHENEIVAFQGVSCKDGAAIICLNGYLLAIDKKDRIIKFPQTHKWEFLFIGFDGRVYRHVIENKVYIQEWKKDHVVTHALNGPGPDELLAQTQFVLPNNFLEISYQTNSNGILVHNFRTNKLQVYSIKDFGGEANEIVFLVTTFNDTNGYNIFTQKAIYELDNSLKLKSRNRITDILPGENEVNFCFTDSFRNSWYSTNNNGVWFKYDVPLLFTKRGQIPILKGCSFKCVLPNGNSFWYSEKNKVLYGLDTSYHIIFKKKIADQVLCVSQVNDSIIDIADRMSIIRYNLSMKTTIPFFYDRPVVSSGFTIGNERSHFSSSRIMDSFKHVYTKNIRSIYQHSKDVMYWKTNTGISKLTVSDSVNYVQEMTLDRFAGMFYDSSCGFLCCYNNGKIYLLYPGSDKEIVVPHNVLKQAGVNFISDIGHDNKGHFYILSGNKLYVFNFKKLLLQAISLNYDVSFAKIAVFNNTLAIAGTFGILTAAIDKQERVSAFRIFLKPRERFNDVKGVYADGRGGFFLETDKDTYTFSSRELQNSNAEYADGHEFTRMVIKSDNSITTLYGNDTIILSAKNVRFSLDMINFRSTGDVSYKYRINRGDWEATPSGEVLYNWDPGQYYRVECVASDALWNSRKYTFYVMQAPYWWQTTTWKRIFWAGGILLLIGLGIITALVTRYYVRRKSEKKQALTDMELRALYAQINPHFIFNTLGTAQFFINRKKMDEAYNHVNKFARLLRAYLKASSSRYVNLGEEISLLKDYIELQQIRFEQKFDYRIEVDNKIAKDSMQVPSLLLQPLVENAINHGLFHLPEGSKGMLEIRFEQGRNSEELVCYIEDNGVGRERSKTLKKDSTIEKDKSYGTTLTKKLIDIFKEYEKMNIYIEYIDKPAPETGTIVKLTIGNIKYTV